MPVTYSLIASNTLSSSAASVTFSAIPNTYTDLVLRCSVRSNRATGTDYALMTLNGGTSGYSATQVYGTGSSSFSSRFSNDSYIWGGEINAAAQTANTFTSVEFYLPNYTGSTSKPLSSFFAQENNATQAYLYATAGLSNLSSAVTSIKLETYVSYAAQFVSGSSFFLYGIKNS